MSIELQIDLADSNFQLKIEQLDASIKTQVQQRLREIAESIKETAQSLAPVRTGYLRSTIFTEVFDEWAVKLGAKAPYAAYVEYGTRYVTARHFLSNAVEQHRPQVVGMMSQVVNEGIVEATR